MAGAAIHSLSTACIHPIGVLPTLLQAEYSKLQALYEDLKAAKIDEEVQQLLEQQNRHVTEHGQKAAQLVEHYKAEVGAGAGACAHVLVGAAPVDAG